MCERCVVTSSVAAPAPRPLKEKAERGLIARVRELLRRAVRRAEVIAQLDVHLGERLDVERRLDHGEREVTNVSVTIRIAATVPLPGPQPSERRRFFLKLPLAPI
jgi:hypothetical protein